ncbi:MAG: ABC transporter ATP-binding protein [Acidobacteriota bacterium]
MGLIELAAVEKELGRAPHRVRALDGIDLTVEEGELLVVTGESGSGKSTLLSLLGALDRPSSGRVSWDGVSVDELDDEALTRLRRERLGFVFQDFLLLRALTALENLQLGGLFGPRVDEAAARELLDRVGLAERGGHRPDALSRGEMQRVALARALATEPEVLLADEPTANLDQRNADALWDLLRELHRERGLTMVVATHDATRSEAADRTVRLHAGRIADHEPS